MVLLASFTRKRSELVTTSAWCCWLPSLASLQEDENTSQRAKRASNKTSACCCERSELVTTSAWCCWLPSLANIEEDENTRDESRDMAPPPTSTTKLTHSIRFAHSLHHCFIKNAPRFARRSSSNPIEIQLDLSVLTPSHTGIQTTSFSRCLSLSNFHTFRPLLLAIKKILKNNNLDDPFSGGVSSYQTVLMVVFLLLRKKILIREQKDKDSPTSQPQPPSPSPSYANGDLEVALAARGFRVAKAIMRPGLGSNGSPTTASNHSPASPDPKSTPQFDDSFEPFNFPNLVDLVSSKSPPANFLVGQLLLDFFELFGEEVS